MSRKIRKIIMELNITRGKRHRERQTYYTYTLQTHISADSAEYTTIN